MVSLQNAQQLFFLTRVPAAFAHFSATLRIHGLQRAAQVHARERLHRNMHTGLLLPRARLWFACVCMKGCSHAARVLFIFRCHMLNLWCPPPSPEI